MDDRRLTQDKRAVSQRQGKYDFSGRTTIRVAVIIECRAADQRPGIDASARAHLLPTLEHTFPEAVLMARHRYACSPPFRACRVPRHVFGHGNCPVANPRVSPSLPRHAMHGRIRKETAMQP